MENISWKRGKALKAEKEEAAEAKHLKALA